MANADDMKTLTIYSETRLQEALGELRNAWKASKYLRISYSDEKGRTGSQNAISHAWYGQIARELGEDTPEGVKCECKLRFGVPILRAEDAEFNEVYERMAGSLSYENQIKLMRIIPITSIMTVSQLSRYLTDVQRAYADRVWLEFPQQEEA